MPVIAKEVGWGISEQAARQLASAASRRLTWPAAGAHRGAKWKSTAPPTPAQRRVAGRFRDWGIPTAESILMARRGAPALAHHRQRWICAMA